MNSNYFKLIFGIVFCLTMQLVNAQTVVKISRPVINSQKIAQHVLAQTHFKNPVVALSALREIHASTISDVVSTSNVGNIRINPKTNDRMEVYVLPRGITVDGYVVKPFEKMFVVAKENVITSAQVLPSEEVEKWLQAEYANSKDFMDDLLNYYEGKEPEKRWSLEEEAWVEIYPIPVDGISISHLSREGETIVSELGKGDVMIRKPGITVQYQDGSLAVLDKDYASTIDFVVESNFHLMDSQNTFIDFKTKDEVDTWPKQ